MSTDDLAKFIRDRDAAIRAAIAAMARGENPDKIGVGHIAAIFHAAKTMSLREEKISSVELSPMAPGNARYIAALCHTMPTADGDNVTIDPSAELADPTRGARLLGALLEISGTLYLSPCPATIAFRATGAGPMSPLDLPHGRSYLQSRPRISRLEYQAIAAEHNPWGWCAGDCNPFMCGGTHGLLDGTLTIGADVRKKYVLVVRGSMLGSVWRYDVPRRVMLRVADTFESFVIAALCPRGRKKRSAAVAPPGP